MQFVNLRRGQPTPLNPPVESLDDYWSPVEKAMVEHVMRYAAVGAPPTVRDRLGAFVEMTQADELMIAAQIYDHTARKRSYQLIAEVRDALGR
jgi:alkanesulfonate monooxygenase SsuD/methylene tetrahydromethanopterin reductase-like flavin-dependent oxidoreductase (luciferase family)